MEPVKICQSQKRVVQSLIASLVGFTLFLIIILFGWKETFEIIRILAVICVPAFGCSSIYNLIQLTRKNQPLILFNEEGVVDRSNFLAVGLIYWSEIEGEAGMMYNNQPYLRLEISRIDTLLQRLKPLRRLAVQIRLWLMRCNGCIPINAQHTGMLPDQIIQEMQKARALAGVPSPGKTKPDAVAQPEKKFSKYDC